MIHETASIIRSDNRLWCVFFLLSLLFILCYSLHLDFLGTAMYFFCLCALKCDINTRFFESLCDDEPKKNNSVNWLMLFWHLPKLRTFLLLLFLINSLFSSAHHWLSSFLCVLLCFYRQFNTWIDEIIYFYAFITVLHTNLTRTELSKWDFLADWMHAEHRKSQNKTTYFRAADIFDYFLRRKLLKCESERERAHLTHSHTIVWPPRVWENENRRAWIRFLALLRASSWALRLR